MSIRSIGYKISLNKFSLLIFSHDHLYINENGTFMSHNAAVQTIFSSSLSNIRFTYLGALTMSTYVFIIVKFS